MARRTAVKDIPSTPHFDFIFGQYQLSSWHIPYFSTSMALTQAALHLRLATDFPGAESINWKLEELFQRDIDWGRVEDGIVPYLHAPEQPQFFNALTIALMPLKNGTVLGESFAEAAASWSPPKLDSPERFPKTLAIGPLQLGYWDDWNEPSELAARTGQLRWNPDQAFAVALDGQHRLAAIQELVRGSDPRYDQTRVPIILLALDERLGFRNPTKRPLVEVLRGLFIDLNKHARTVERARLIVLDDKDPYSLCVRTLIGEQLVSGLDELKATPPRLPLSLVDWHTEQAKFDDGPYVTTILGLDWTVEKVLNAKPIRDYTDYKAVAKQIKAFCDIGADLTQAEARRAELEDAPLQPFSYSDNPNNHELDHIAEVFGDVWRPALVKLFTQFSPYQTFIELRKKKHGFSSEFSNWYNLYTRARVGSKQADSNYRNFVARLRSRQEDPIAEETLKATLKALEAHKAEHGLAFTVVFQRAYILAFVEFAKIKDHDLEELSEGEEQEFDFDDEEEWEAENGDVDEEPTEEEDVPLAERLLLRAEQFISAMNGLIEADPEILRVDMEIDDVDPSDTAYFWQGTLRKPEGGIDFTQGAAGRACDILFWTAAISTYKEVNESNEDADFDLFWEAVGDCSTSFTRRVNRSLNRFYKQSRSAAGRILTAAGYDVEEDGALEEAKLRMRWLWEALES
jgi:hypothetical protein